MFLGDSGSIAGGQMWTPAAAPSSAARARTAGGARPTRRTPARAAPGARSRPGWGGEVDVAAPDPGLRLLRHVPPDAGRLRVVDDDHVPAARDLGGVERVVALVDLPLLVAERVGVALERVVEALRGVVELLAAEHHLPLGLDAHVVHQRDQRVEDLRHAAAERGRGEVQHPQALEVLGELPDLLDERPAGQVGVVGQALVAYGNRLQHGAAAYSANRGQVLHEPRAPVAEARLVHGRLDDRPAQLLLHRRAPGSRARRAPSADGRRAAGRRS